LIDELDIGKYFGKNQPLHNRGTVPVSFAGSEETYKATVSIKLKRKNTLSKLKT
jgi:hypothetical protein